MRAAFTKIMATEQRYDYLRGYMESVLESVPDNSHKAPLVVVDESLNDPKVEKAIIHLCNGGQASGSVPLWNERRVRQDGSIQYVWAACM